MWSSSGCDLVSLICTNRHSSVWENHAFWTALGRFVKEVYEHEQLSVLTDANACTGRRGGGMLGSEECKIFSVYGRDTLSDSD